LLPRLDNAPVPPHGLCDIVLDSIGWSGMQFDVGGPAPQPAIVTMTGPLMRGRHSMAILKMMEVEETF